MCVEKNSGSLLCIALSFVLMLSGCSERSKAETPEGAPQTTESLLQTINELNTLCRGGAGDEAKTEKACSDRETKWAEAESRGWCWGPSSAATIHKGWMQCADDVTRDAALPLTWFDVSSTGNCSEIDIMDAIEYALDHDGKWNVKTSLTSDGVLEISSHLASGEQRKIRLFSSCEIAMLARGYKLNKSNTISLHAPLGLSPREAGQLFGFEYQSCAAYSMGGTGLGCSGGLSHDGKAPIVFSDGFTPCREGGNIKYDFSMHHGMVGVTCAASAESLKAFNGKMNEIYGQGKLINRRDLSWSVGSYLVTSSKYILYSKTLRKVSISSN